RASWRRRRRRSESGRTLLSSSLTSFDYPDISELHRHAVLLQLDRTSGRLAEPRGIQGHGAELAIVVERGAVELHGDARPSGLLAGGVEPRCVEVDVQCLPFERRTRAANPGP